MISATVVKERILLAVRLPLVLRKVSLLRIACRLAPCHNRVHERPQGLHEVLGCCSELLLDPEVYLCRLEALRQADLA